MKQRPVLEKAIVLRIVAALRNVHGIVVRKRHGTAMGVAGDPDLYGTYNGRHFEIEVKRPYDSSSELTEVQFRRLREWKRAGAIVGVARSVGDALLILGLNPTSHPLVELAPYANRADAAVDGIATVEAISSAYQGFWTLAK